MFSHNSRCSGTAQRAHYYPRGDHRDRQRDLGLPHRRLPAPLVRPATAAMDSFRRSRGQGTAGPQGLHAGPRAHFEHGPDDTRSSAITATMVRGRSARRRPQPETARAAKARSFAGQATRILCIHLGTPPERFDCSDGQDQNFHRYGVLPPHEFARQVRGPAGQTSTSALVNDPRRPFRSADLHRRVASGQRHRRPAGHLPQTSTCRSSRNSPRRRSRAASRSGSAATSAR